MEKEVKKRTFVVTFEATTTRSYIVEANTFEEAGEEAFRCLDSDETVSKAWAEEADIVKMKEEQ